MALKVEYDNPAYPKDTEFDVCGVLVPNGGSVTLTEEQEQAIVSREQVSAKDALSGNEFLKVTGTASISGKELEELTPEVSDTVAFVAPGETEEVEDKPKEGGEA